MEKKSEQAEFTGIDDGNDETIIDLSIQKGMMNGLFGNVMAGAGHDVRKQVSGSDSHPETVTGVTKEPVSWDVSRIRTNSAW